MWGLYIHIPFCLKKCRYCSFYSVPVYNSPVAKYLGALVKELDFVALDNPAFDTIYIGGGTPSVVDPAMLSRSVDKIAERLQIGALKEFTIEANPCSLNREKLEQYKALGINRISIGVQSLNDEELAFLGRSHTEKEAIKSIELSAKIGFSNISVDIIYGIPGQNLSTFEKTLAKIVRLPVSHISAYSLSYEEGTPLFESVRSGEIKPVNPEYEAKLYRFLQDFLDGAGFHQYEISSFARIGFKAIHNIKYWQRESYLGLGASATSTDYTKNLRWTNIPNIFTYINSPMPVRHTERIDLKESIIEYIMLSLRLTRGISTAEFNSKFGFKIEGYVPEKLVQDGYLRFEQGRLFIPPEKMFVSNEIISTIIDNVESELIQLYNPS
jgi:oxygen-independent coproporphyrinogen-3 oxidase